MNHTASGLHVINYTKVTQIVKVHIDRYIFFFLIVNGMWFRRVSRSAGSTRDVNIAASLTSQEQGVLSCHYSLMMMLFI